MESGTYAQINYNPDDLDDVSVTEVDRQATAEKAVDSTEKIVDEQPVTQETAEAEQETTGTVTEELLEETTQSLEEMAERMAEETAATTENDEEALNEVSEFNEASVETKETVETVESTEEANTEKNSTEQVSEETVDTENVEEPVKEKVVMVPDEVTEVLNQYLSSTIDIQRTLRRLESKFAEEILNGENRDGAVKTMYKEMNEYKAGIVEKALKNVLYDIVDIRETMLSQIKYLREKNGAESISLDEFESYTDDIADILEKHDVTIYKGEPGEENVAVRQKIVRKVETEDEALVKTVAESLSYGYEYASKILYPEKISVYVKKK